MSISEKKKMGLPLQLAIALALGVIAGFIFKDYCSYIGFIGTIFIRLLKMCVYPLVLFSIISGVANVASIGKLRKIGGTFLAYAFCTTAIAGILGTMAAKLTGVGHGLILKETVDKTNQEGVNMVETFVNWVPANIFESLSTGTLIQIIVFAIFFGTVITLLKSQNPEVDFVSKIVNGCNDIMNAMVAIVMKVAPIGVFALIANLVGTTGLENLKNIFTMVVTLWGASLVHVLIVLPLILKIFAKVNPFKFFKNVLPAILMAFSTQSSAATLPVTMKCAKENNGVDDEIINLCAAPAATINMDGAAIEYTIYTIFAANAFGVNFSPIQFIFLVALCIVCSAGAAGVPGGGIVMCSICLATMGLPNAEVTAMVAGVYVLLDMAATTLNVTGDNAGMVVIASRMGTLDREKFNS
ncbi:MAG: dicarboxylate/amino acid:cation symporter [Eubacterium sp.]|nr:dicarboxylate/amino acid:cation symporter [Eubacterium sp.]